MRSRTQYLRDALKLFMMTVLVIVFGIAVVAQYDDSVYIDDSERIRISQTQESFDHTDTSTTDHTGLFIVPIYSINRLIVPISLQSYFSEFKFLPSFLFYYRAQPRSPPLL